MFSIPPLFPDILFLGPFYVPLILRVVIGLVFVWFAYQHVIKRRVAIREAVATRPFVIPSLSSVLRPFASSFAFILGVGELLIGSAFLVGFMTQAASLLAIVVLTKKLFFRRYLREIAFESSLLYLVLVAIAIALLISGPGALAFDRPF